MKHGCLKVLLLEMKLDISREPDAAGENRGKSEIEPARPVDFLFLPMRQHV